MKKFNKIIGMFMTISMSNSCVFATVGEIQGKVTQIVNVIAYFGYAIAFGMLAFIGIKYVMSPANEKADVKRGAINYLIGAFFIICASGVANLFAGIATSGGGATTGLADKIIQAGQTAAGT